MSNDEELVDWIRDTTGAVDLQIERRSGGASREGYAVNVRTADGSALVVAACRFGRRTAVRHAVRVAS